MTRVSENSSTSALNFALNKAKSKLEDLQLKGASLKRITRPSDDPASNIEALNIGSMTSDNKQYLRNASNALLQLNTTEKALEQLTDIMNKAKEIAIAQSSDFYDANIRKNVANEINQLRNQSLAIANKRIGNRYIFGGHSTLKPPFNAEGSYTGDKGKINLEISKDFFIPINLHGNEVFFSDSDSSYKLEHPLEKIEDFKETKKGEKNIIYRELASVENPEGEKFESRENVFSLLSALSTGLENNDPELIQDLLNKFDDATSRLITLRTRVGSIYSSVETTRSSIESENIDHAERKSFLMDADIAELFSNITRQQSVLETTYHSGKKLMNQNLLDFLR